MHEMEMNCIEWTAVLGDFDIYKLGISCGNYELCMQMLWVRGTI